MAAKHFILWTERKGEELRRVLGLGPLDQLDPFELARRRGIRLYDPSEVKGLTFEDLICLLEEDQKSWSGGTLVMPNGQIAVVLNPTHAPTRKCATLMEEVAHIHLKHKPSKLTIIGPLAFRDFNKTQETQAYWVGASALVTRSHLQYALRQNMSKKDLADMCGVSVQLVQFRENLTGTKLSKGA